MAESRANRAPIPVGVDTGGTFTDFVAVMDGRLRTAKVLSTPDDPARAITRGLAELGLDTAPVDLVHGTTVGTNAVLEGKGARVAFVTTTGFGDLLSLGRQNRDDLYRLEQPPVAAPVPPELCLEINARGGPDGTAVATPERSDLEQLARRVKALAPEAVAVDLLFSWRNPELEQAIASAIADALPDTPPVSLSSEVLPEIREYERGIATWLNAAIGPRLSGYLGRLQDALTGGRLAVMQSSGLTISADQAAHGAVHLLLSGPAGGLAAAAHIGTGLGLDRVLSFDMGGTSTDVALLHGRPTLTREGRIGPYPVAVPMVDMHTIGAGGGSIARIDPGGLLQVGPESAGADPGPACYGQGGVELAVTDANLLLGRLPRDTLLGGRHALDYDAAKAALDRLAEAGKASPDDMARGVIRLANEHMSRALRVMSAARGIDPRQAALMCFGGAGGLHVCELAESLGMRRAVVPARSGVLSALGMLVAEPGRQATRALLQRCDTLDSATLDAAFEPLIDDVRRALAAEGIDRDGQRLERWTACRYAGQSATLELVAEAPDALIKAFHDAHEQAWGHRLDLPVEIVGLRVEARGPARLDRLPDLAGDPQRREVGGTPVVSRAALADGTLAGPAIITDSDATTWLAAGWNARLSDPGHLLLQRD